MMSPQAKVDLGAKAEAMLASWPAPPSDDAAWENRAAKIVAAATNAPRATDAELAALFAKPALDAEPGEMESSNVSAASGRSASGVKAMSESNTGSPGSPSSPSIPPASGAVSKRPSLKELAARANQANASGSPSMRPSAPASLPPPSAEGVSQEKRASTPAPVAAPLKASVPPPRPIEASTEDSGRVNLNAITQAAAAPAVAAAEAKPATDDPVDNAAGEDKPAAASDKGDDAKVKNIADARAKKTKKKGEAAKTNEAAKTSETAKVAEAAPVAATAKKADDEGGGGKWVILAALALAAGGFLYFRGKQQPPPPPPAAVVQEKPDTTPIVAAQQKIEEPKPASTGLSVDALPAATPSASAKKEAPKVAAVNTAEEAAPPPPQPPEPTAPTALATATAGGKPGDLSSAMAQAVGGSTEKPVNADDATPAAAKTGSQTIPEQPPQGSVAAAMRGVTPGAKACVAGADEPSHANVTFSSAGTVSNVSVSGWASKNGKADCIKAALKGANVGPFSKPSFTVGVPVRP